MDTFEYWTEVIKRMKYAQLKGCTTVILTGSNEPQQDRRWLEGLYLAMQQLSEPFLNIEIQTTGALIDLDYLKFLKAMGVTTLAVSTFNIFDDVKNREIIECCDKNLNLQKLCDDAYSIGLNVRICINITNHVFTERFYKSIDDFITSKIDVQIEEMQKQAAVILTRCSQLHASQVTFRKMWSNPGTPEADWIKEHCTFSETLITTVNDTVKANGTLLRTLPYGAKQYDYNGFSIVTDTDSMAKDQNNEAIKYYIIRENGKMYSLWDSPASLIF